MWWLYLLVAAGAALLSWLVSRTVRAKEKLDEQIKMAPTPESARIEINAATAAAQAEADQRVASVDTATDEEIQNRVNELRAKGRAK